MFSVLFLCVCCVWLSVVYVLCVFYFLVEILSDCVLCVLCVVCVVFVVCVVCFLLVMCAFHCVVFLCIELCVFCCITVSCVCVLCV